MRALERAAGFSIYNLGGRRPTRLDDLVAGVAGQVRPADVVLIQAGSIPKTSSGKIRRFACRERFLSGDLNVV